MIKKLLSIALFALASLTSLARPHGEAFAILIEKANITRQCFQFYDQWSTQDVEDIWNQGRNAKSVNYTRAGWLAISQKESADQKYKYSSFKEIKKVADNEAKNGIFLHSLTLAEVGTRWYWIGLSENRPNISRQVVEMVKTSKLNQWMAEKAQQGLKVINCARKITECAVVAHDGTDIDRQEACLYETAQEALNDVKRHWEAGWRVGLIDVSPMNKYTIVYNTYTTPREGEQYLAFCDSRESAKNFINEHAHNGYFITHVGGAFYPGATDENGNPIPISTGGMSYGDEPMIELYAVTQEQYDAVMAVIDSTTSFVDYDQNVLNLISDEAAGYLAGSKTVEEASKFIQSRVSLYIQEQK